MKLFSVILGLAVILIAREASADPTVVISEFRAINNSTLADEDGTYADWIELYNTSTNAVNLGGWYLANKATNLTHWMFPSTNLGPSQFLVVFASNKDRRVSGAPLHTNFKLGGSGEYLALVLPDGVTKASEFAPGFPQQYADISYGYVMTGAVSTLVVPNASARAWVPSSDIGTSWRLAGYNDSAWAAGTLGVGYDASGNYAPAIGLDLKAAMLNINASAYVRVPFIVTNPAAFNLLTLSLRYDDGFVAYLNGTEVLRRNAPSALVLNSSATAAHGAPSPGSLAESFEGSATNYTLTQYGASPAPAVQAAGTNSTGKFLRLLYDGVNGSANTIAFRKIAPGLFQSIVADFDFRISSSVNNPADGFAFMIIPTAVYGTNGAGVNITSQAVEKPNYVGVFGIGFDVYPHPQVNNVSAHWNGAQAVNVTMPTSTFDLAAGVFHHAKVSLQYVTGGASVTVTLTRNINGTPGTPYSPITNWFIAGMNPFDCRIQFGGRTGGLNLALDLDNCNVQFLPQPGPIAFEDFDISSSVNPLLPGQNLLALQGLNLTPGNSNFLVQAQLTGRKLVMIDPPTYLYPPTPGAWNNSIGAAVVPPPVTFYPPAGVYTNSTLPVTLASSSSSAVVHYTLDGSAPGSSSLVYTHAIPLTSNAVLRAVAVLQGLPGPVAAANYVLIDSTLTNFTSNLPLVIIDTLGQAIPDVTKIGAYAVFINTNALGGRASLNNPGDYVGRVGIGLHGQSSLQFPKQPYKVELDDESDAPVDYALLGMPAGNDWDLYPPYSDKTLMNNLLSYELFESMGHYSVRRKYFELFLRSTPGKLTADDYQGVYVLLEKIRVATNLVNIAQLKTTDNTPPAVTGGYIIAKDKYGTNDLTFTSSSGQLLLVYRPKADAITPPQLDYITGYVNTLEAALYGSAWRDPASGYAAYLDADSFVDLHWISEYSKNIDAIRLSDYMSKDRNGKLVAGPIWDWDLAWGNADYVQGGNTNGWYYPQLSDNDDIWLRRLRTDPDFYQKITDRWGALRLNVFNATNLFARIDQITNQLWEAQARDFARWPRLGTYVWPNPNGAAGGWDVDYVTPTNYDGIISQFKSFVLGRYLWVDAQFVPAPTLLTNGATLSLSAPLGSSYYTLDNTDPRASGGGLSASARLYSGTVALTNNAGIFARAFYTNAWSAPAKALYIAALPALRITEINYHPAPPPTNSPYQDKDFEYIEIQNTGSNVINLAGASIGGGIGFTFAPSEFVTVGTATSNNFAGGGTPFTASTLGQIPGPYLTNDGPAGNLLCLLNSRTNATRNRITFNQTASGDYDRLTADFDFRATTTAPAAPGGAPTLANFDSAGTTYALISSGATAPAVLAADTNSTGSYLRLVPALGGEMGAIAFNRTATGAFNSAVATFDFRITPPDGATRADGMGFALLNTAVYGTNGAGPYFAEEPSLTSSIGVGFDVYANASTPQELNNNHISLHWNGAQVGNAATPSFSLSSGKFHRAQILVWFYGGNAYVTVRLTPNINGTPGPTETVFQDALIPGAAAYQSRVAFGARTGGAWAAHDLDNVNVQFSANAAAAAGLSLLVLPTSQFGTNGRGTTLATFTDWPLVTNTLALDLAFSPSNLVNDVSLYWNAALAFNVSLPPAALNLDAGVFHHARLQLDAASGGTYATLTLTSNSLGTAGAPLNVFSNCYIAGVALGNSRLEFAGRNGGLLGKVDLDNALTSFQSLAPILLNPGESIVVVHNLAAFISRYGTGIRVAGEFSGSLDNAGERLTLFGPLGEPILDFSYDPTWYPITDGGGFSLVAVDPTALPSAWGLAQNWRPSSGLGGSPGATDPAPPPAVLTAALAPGHVLRLAWPAGSGNFTLYSTAALDTPSQWSRVTNAPALLGDQWMLDSLPPTNRAFFYRLEGQPAGGP
jgi:hypothetical protein